MNAADAERAAAVERAARAVLLSAHINAGRNDVTDDVPAVVLAALAITIAFHPAEQVEPLLERCRRELPDQVERARRDQLDRRPATSAA